MHVARILSYKNRMIPRDLSVTNFTSYMPVKPRSPPAHTHTVTILARSLPLSQRQKNMGSSNP